MITKGSHSKRKLLFTNVLKVFPSSAQLQLGRLTHFSPYESKSALG